MKTKLLLLITTLFFSLLAFADSKGNIVVVSATYNYTSDSKHETIAQAEQKALERAKIKALEEKFGVDISNVSSTVLKNNQSNGDAITETEFYSMGFSNVQGEWIETIEEKTSIHSCENGLWSLTAKVKGKARAKNAASIEIETTILRNGTDDINCSDKFKSGDDLYVQFSAPVDGYVCIYLVGEDNLAYCLLPDKYHTQGSKRVKANTKYIFFSEKHAERNEQVEEYQMTAQRSIEQNQIWIIFSPNQFYKAHDDDTSNNWHNQPMPRSLTYKELMTWFGNNSSRDEQMVVKRDVITIYQ